MPILNPTNRSRLMYSNFDKFKTISILFRLFKSQSRFYLRDFQKVLVLTRLIWNRPRLIGSYLDEPLLPLSRTVTSLQTVIDLKLVPDCPYVGQSRSRLTQSYLDVSETVTYLGEFQVVPILAQLNLRTILASSRLVPGCPSRNQMYPCLFLPSWTSGLSQPRSYLHQLQIG